MDDATNPQTAQDVSSGKSLPARYFEDVYAANRDPWHFETSPYEAEKYSSSLAILPRPHYVQALEIGCSIGVFTRMLGLRCGSLLAIDVAEQALAEARRRCADQPNISFQKLRVPGEFPVGSFDLITVCEVGYYMSADDLRVACFTMAQHQPQGADLLLVHFTPLVQDYPLPGDTVHDVWLSRPWWQSLATRRHATYRMDVLRRNDVAAT